MKREERDARFDALKNMPCIACQIEGVAQPSPTEIHHLNLGGKAGQRRRGDEFTIPLCGHHHRGDPIRDVTADHMASIYGPSFARNSRLFRFSYGSDDQLLALTNHKLKVTA